MPVLAALLLARGPAVGREGLLRGVIAAGIMLAPQPGYGAFVLLLAPDHVGTQVPLLLGWLLLDRAPRRWWVPAILGALLTVVQIADRLALITAVLPLVVVCAAAVARPARAGAGVRGPGKGGRYELALAGAAIASVGLSWAAARALTAAGGFTAHPFPLTVAPLRLLWTHTWLTGWGVLELYGANFLVAASPAGGAGYAAQVMPPAAVRATFGPPARVYRFGGYTVLVWNVNLLTRLLNSQVRTDSVASLTCWKRPPMRHPDTNWNKFVGIDCAPRPRPRHRGLPGCASRSRSRRGSEDAG